MKELTNKVTVTGTLVKNDISEFKTKKGKDAIGGVLVLRTSDGSEHEIKFYSDKYKTDDNGNETSEEKYFYGKYVEAMELKDIEHCKENEHPEIISITDGSFSDNDFKGKNDGNVYSNNTISAKFINRVEPKDYESTVLEAKFEVEGIIESIKDEIKKDIPTGNLAVTITAINQRQKDYNDANSYEADHLIPIKMIVDKGMATAFKQAGYYEGGFTKMVGSVINSVEIVKQIEKAAFGTDIEKEVKSYVRKNDIKSGTAVSTIFEHELTQEVVDALIAKRKAKLAEVKSGVGAKTENDSPFKPDTSTPAPQTTYNPFAQK